jgi:hypothetical protein
MYCHRHANKYEIYLYVFALDKTQWRTLMYTVIELLVPFKVCNSLIF